ncbi:MAG: hypothetical protein QOF60_129 [Actinomycetota bacterium]|jgi:hypothetical protein|nr:hypothetical protein [Actinomycetota bacterium]
MSRPGPQIECQVCELPILLAFAEHSGADRSLACPCCGDVQRWTIADVTTNAREAPRSSVE